MYIDMIHMINTMLLNLSTLHALHSNIMYCFLLQSKGFTVQTASKTFMKCKMFFF